MVLLTKESKGGYAEQALFIAENDSEYKILEYLYHSGIVFGAYMLYNFKEDELRTSDAAVFLMKTFPLATGLMKVNNVRGFVKKDMKDEAN